MSFVQPGKHCLFCAALLASVFGGLSRLGAQVNSITLPRSVQQDQFRSQWVGQQVDQSPSGAGFSSLGGLGALVGSQQTPDQVQREAAASRAGLNAPSPFEFHPSLGIGWQAASGGQSGSSSNSSEVQSSSFAAPALLISYNRDHGPWNIGAAYSTGYRYYINQGYTGAGTGSAQNPFSQTAMFRATLQMSRYEIDNEVTASTGSGFDTTSATFNLQKAISLTSRIKYELSSSTSVAADAGYSLQNASQSLATPNNNTSSGFADCSEIYNLTQKTHLSLIVSGGFTSQTLQQGTTSAGNASLANTQNENRTYGQGLFKVKYLVTDKLVCDVGLGARYVSSSIIDSKDVGLSPAWTLGVGYTPTPKTSVTLGTGLQGADVTPELSLILSWLPREKTHFTIGLSQTEQFANSLSGEYFISRNLTGTITQKLFSSLDLSLIGGYSTQNYINLSTQTLQDQSSEQLPSNYYFGSLSLFWKIRPSANLVNTLTCSSSQQSAGSGSSAKPQYLYSIGLNLQL